MPANTKEVKLRLNSIKNTQKITKAMELVAGAKMRKAVEGAIRTRDYYNLAWQIAGQLTKTKNEDEKPDPNKRFFAKIDNPKHIAIVVFTSNRGLCGAFNSNIIKLVLSYIEKIGKKNVSLICVGNKGVTRLSSLGFKIDLAYKKDDKALNDISVIEIADYVHKKFKNAQTDKVAVIYTDYVSAIAQKPRIYQLYPLMSREQIVESPSVKTTTDKPGDLTAEYLYEPNKEELLSYLIPRIAQVELFQALLESNASEHSARMVAMKNANEAASDMADELILEFNKVRQAAITKEIAEISAGTAAVL